MGWGGRGGSANATGSTQPEEEEEEGGKERKKERKTQTLNQVQVFLWSLVGLGGGHAGSTSGGYAVSPSRSHGNGGGRKLNVHRFLLV